MTDIGAKWNLAVFILTNEHKWEKKSMVGTYTFM